MEDFPENYFEARLKLSKGEELESGLCEKLFTVSLKNEDKNNFILKATDGEEEYILHLKYSDYINLVEREFSKICNNFQLLFNKLKSSFESKKVVICKTIIYSLKMIFYFKRKTLSFELFPKDYTPSEVIEHLQASDRQYKADLIKYDKKFEDYGDRFIIKCVIENVGTTTWDKKITSLVCLPEYSSLICNEFFFEEEVIPNEQVCIELEYLKKEELNLSPPYFTFLYLQVKGVIFDPGLVLDFNDTFNESNDNKPNFKKKTEIRKKPEKKMIKIIEKYKIKKIKNILEKDKNKNKIIEQDKMNKIIDETKDNNAKKNKSEEKTKLEEEIKDMKNANANLKKELEKQKNEVTNVQEENKQLKKKIEKLIGDNNKVQKETEKKEKEKEKKYKEKIQNLKMKIKELEESIKVNNIEDQGKDINKNGEGSISNEKINEIKKQCQEEMNKKYANIISEKMKEFQEKILNELKQENSRILDNYIKQIQNLKKLNQEKIDSREKEYSYELLSKDLQKNAVQFETKEIDFELQIKNNGNLPWPEDGKAKLVVENKNENEIKINDIKLDNLQKNQVQTLKVNLDIKSTENGTKKIILNFNVDGRNYGKPIILQLDVEENQKVKEMRELFNLQKEDYPDQLLYEKLKKVDFDTEEAFNSLFS